MKKALMLLLLIAVVLPLCACMADKNAQAAQCAVIVTDEDGKPVSGALVQICDGGSCRNYTTDNSGTVTLPVSEYEYEVHLLQVPDGYLLPEEYKLLPLEGGSVAYELKKAD